MSDDLYDEDSRAIPRPGPLSPAVVWGVLMVAALAGAGATLWQGGGDAGPDVRLVAAADGERTLRRDVARLSAERDALTDRLTAVERGLGDMKLAMRDADAPETTGSISRPPAVPAQPQANDRQPVHAFALSLGSDSSLDAVRRRWSALAGRHPQALARLVPLAQRNGSSGGFDLRAGPFTTSEDAKRVCGELAEQGLACDTTAYAGEPLGRP